MDYLPNVFRNPFRNQKRQLELILPFTYNVEQRTEVDYLSCGLCKNNAPFAVYGKPLGEKAATTTADANAPKTLSMVYDLVLITPKDHAVFS